MDSVLRELVQLKEMRGGNLGVMVSFVMSDLTAPEMDAVRRYTEGMGALFNLQWYNDATYYDNLGRDLLRSKHPIERIVKTLPPTAVRDLGIDFLKGKSIRYPCLAFRNFCVLKCNGDMAPCFNLWNVNVGNIREATPSLIWKSAAAKKARRRVRSCEGCLNTCGVLWSFDSSYIWKVRFGLRHPEVLLGKAAGGLKKKVRDSLRGLAVP